VREREAKAAVRDRPVAIGSPTNQCRRPDVNGPKRVFNDHIEYGHYVNRTAIGPLATANRRGARETRMTLRRQSRGISLTSSRPSRLRCSRIRMMPAPRCRDAAGRPTRAPKGDGSP
jgi:hypothetical protein